ncbi:MAG: DUF3800 domain-containing protein [Candidatus Goldbacteria bacterium]|nr:DUF3800 domain-containing protein [Candidatus Goldiibacteriota bacterium]
MQYLYLDESGDLGFDFVNKKVSKFFTITILSLNNDEDNKKLKNAIIKTKKRIFKNRNIELKGAKTSMQAKETMHRNLKNVNYELYSITLNKRRVNKELTVIADRLYNYIANQILQNININSETSRVNLIVDKSKGKKEIDNFNKYIINNLKGRIPPKIPIDINHQNSDETPGL